MHSKKLMLLWLVSLIQTNAEFMIKLAVKKLLKKENKGMEVLLKGVLTTVVMILFHQKTYSIISFMVKKSHVAIIDQDRDNSAVSNSNKKKK